MARERGTGAERQLRGFRRGLKEGRCVMIARCLRSTRGANNAELRTERVVVSVKCSNAEDAGAEFDRTPYLSERSLLEG